MIQFVSHVLPPSAEKACRHRQEFAAMSDHYLPSSGMIYGLPFRRARQSPAFDPDAAAGARRST
jgi:hypothetical protein